MEREKGLDDYFYDWYHEAFGYGYGTGDEFYCEDLYKFFDMVVHEYSYEKLENYLGKSSAWYMINELCKSDCLEYGTSPRYGWLTRRGKLMKDVISNYNQESLYEFVNSRDSTDDYVECYKDYCNHTKLESKGCLSNPFWYLR